MSLSSDEEVMLRKRNEELIEELRKSEEREMKMRQDMSATWERLRVVEEAEERLCQQLGELEAETVEQSRSYEVQIVELMEQLAQAKKLILEAGLSSTPTSATSSVVS